MQPRICIFAYSQLGFDALSYILGQKNGTVCAVFTHPPDSREFIWFDAVDRLALSHNIPVYYDDPIIHLNLFVEQAFDLILSFYYRSLIPTSIIKTVRLGAFNMHGSFLPNYRGRAPVNWAIIEGQIETGATLHRMIPKADAGPIVDQERVPIYKKDNAASVQKKVNDAAITILKRTFPKLCTGSASESPQDLTQGFYRPGRTPRDGVIQWELPAIQIYNLIRGVTPYPQYPGAWAKLKTQMYRVEIISHNFTRTIQKPGTIIQTKNNPNGTIYRVACGDELAISVFALSH